MKRWTERQTDRMIPIYPSKPLLQGYNNKKASKIFVMFALNLITVMLFQNILAHKLKLSMVLIF